jgi:hypothetical protein
LVYVYSISGYIRTPPSSHLPTFHLVYPKPTKQTMRQNRYTTPTPKATQCYLPNLSYRTTQTSTPHSDPTPQLVVAAASSHLPQEPASLQTESPSLGSTCLLLALVGAEAAAAAVVAVARGCASQWGQALVLAAAAGERSGRVRQEGLVVVAEPGSAGLRKREAGVKDPYNLLARA